MIKNKYSVIGVMSGTSLDGVDLIHAIFYFEKRWHFEIVHFETVSYTNEWYGVLKELVNFNSDELLEIDEKYTTYLSGIIEKFIKKNNLISIDAICSHGHTALHQPYNKLTYQIGNRPIIANILKKKVVCDFRVQDVELGGQGAPLVPIGDKLLFSDYEYCLNLGGFANISTDVNSKRIAYDICPVNIVLNHYVKSLGYSYDDKGNIASKGKLDKAMLAKLNNLDYYKTPYPKSLGLEWVKINIFPLIDAFNLEIPDILKTFCEHVAIQISKSVSISKKTSVLVTGGGAYNDYLLKRIRFFSKPIIVVPSKTIVEFKEALVFGFLGVLKLRHEINCLSSVTGASKDHSSGVVFLP